MEDEKWYAHFCDLDEQRGETCRLLVDLAIVNNNFTVHIVSM